MLSIARMCYVSTREIKLVFLLFEYCVFNARKRSCKRLLTDAMVYPHHHGKN